MFGIAYTIIAGILIGLQNIFNTQVSQKIGMWETVLIVNTTGFIASALTWLFLRDGNLGKIYEVNKLYLIGGVFGVLVVYGVMKGITLSGATFAISTMLIAQLLTALAIDTFGLFGTTKIPFDLTKPLGVLIMIAGIIVFKLK